MTSYKVRCYGDYDTSWIEWIRATAPDAAEEIAVRDPAVIGAETIGFCEPDHPYPRLTVTGKA